MKNSKEQITIDIGCGSENHLPFYGFKGKPTIAVDISRPFLERRRVSEQSGILVQADAAALPIKSEVADRVFATHVLEHVDRLPETLDEIKRILKPGEKVTIAVPDPKYEKVMSKLEEEYCSRKMHQRVISPDDLRGKLEGRGLIIVKNQKRGFVTAVYNTFSYLLHRKLLKDRQMEPQSGKLVPLGETFSRNGVGTSNLKQMLKGLISSRPFSPLFAWFDKIYPFENRVIAIKSVGQGINQPLTTKDSFVKLN